MRKWKGVVGLLIGLVLLLTDRPAQALITALTPLDKILHEIPFIVSARIESVDTEKPALFLVVEDDLKGKLPVRKLSILLKGDAEAKRKNHVPLILKRVAPKLPLVLFLLKQEQRYTAFAYTNGTWFQIVGVEADGAVRWSFTHGEPYLRKTFKGSTEELKQVVIDGLAGKKAPPKPDTKEKPGFGPEVEAEKKSGNRGRSSGDSLFAVIPTVLVGGPLAILAMLFPAVFGGLTLLMRRWMAALSILSLNSTLYVLHNWLSPRLAGTWWGTPAALWLSMTVVTLFGILWAWRRHVAISGERSSTPKPVGWGEIATLGMLGLSCLVFVAFSRPRSLAQLDLVNKMLLMFCAGLWMATLHALYRRRNAARGSAPQLGLPGEGVLLWTMLLAGIGFSTTFVMEAGGAGVTDADSELASAGGQYRVAWRFQPKLDHCWMASSPVADGERVFIGVAVASLFRSGAVYCVDRNTGKEIWMFNDGGDMKNVFSSPCVADGRVYIGEGFHQDANCKLYCLDAATGKKLWDFSTTSHTESTPCVARGKVYFGAGDDGLYCLDAATGKEKWHLTGLHVDASPLVIDNRLYGGSGVGDSYRETVLFCANADTGDLHWRMPVDLPVWGKPAVQGEYLYAGLGNGNFIVSADQLDKPEKPAGTVVCLERATGKRIWSHEVRDGVLARVCVDDRNVWFASRDRNCYCLDRHEGRPCWKMEIGSPVLASPSLVGHGDAKSLYVAGSDGMVHKLDARTGQVNWKFDVSRDAGQPATFFSSPFVQVSEGRKGESLWVWFGCGLNEFTRGILYCLEEQVVETARGNDKTHP